VVLYSQFAMTESVVPSVVLAWLLCLHGLLTDSQERLRARYGVGFGLAAGYAMSVHDRGVVLVVVSTRVLLVALVRRWVPWRAAFAAGATLAVAVLGAELLAAYLQHRFADTPPATVGQFALNGLLNTSLLGRNTGRVLGQLWYLITSTWGIGGLGAAVCAAVAVRRRATTADRAVGAVLLITVVLVAGAAATALSEDHRLDDNVYARYLSVFAPALFVVGVAALYRLGRRALLRYAAATLALIGVCGGGVFLLAGTRLRHDLWYKQTQTAIYAGSLLAIGSLATPWLQPRDPLWTSLYAIPFGAAIGVGLKAQWRGSVTLVKVAAGLSHGSVAFLLVTWRLLVKP
jgi:hypothetical protein